MSNLEATYDLEEQVETEAVIEEEVVSKEVNKALREQKKLEQLQQSEKPQKHKARFTRIGSAINGYICDNCETPYEEDKGTIMHSKDGDFAYCDKCLKILYPNYRKVQMQGTFKRTDFRSNHHDTSYSKGIH